MAFPPGSDDGDQARPPSGGGVPAPRPGHDPIPPAIAGSVRHGSLPIHGVGRHGHRLILSPPNGQNVSRSRPRAGRGGPFAPHVTPGTIVPHRSEGLYG